jgi:hypothetical protein
MSAWRSVAGLLALGLTTGCGAAPEVPTPTNKLAMVDPGGAPPAPRPPTPAVLPRIPEAGPPLPPLTYESKGRRDPFAPVPVIKEKTGLDVASTKLVGIIQGAQLLALVEAPDGLGYILKPGDVLGNGRVTDVTARSVTFAVVGQAGQHETSLTLRLARE